MSLQNLGKVSNFFKGNTNALNGMPIDDMVKSMKALGLSNDAILDAAWNAGKTTDEIKSIADILDVVGDTSEAVSGLDKLKEGFDGLVGIGKRGLSAVTSFLTQNWAVAAAGITLAAVAIVAYNNSFEKLCENAEKSREALAETTSEIQSLQSQKQTNQEEINALKESGSSTNDTEITALERQNALLQAQITLKEQLESGQREQAAKDAEKALTKLQDVETGWDSYEQKDIIDITADDISKLNFYQQKHNEVADSIKAIEDAKESEGRTDYTSDEIKELDRLNSQSEMYQSQINDLTGTVNENKSTILGFYQSLLDSDGKALLGFETTVSRIEELFPELADGSSGLSENMQAISDAYSNALSSMRDGSTKSNLIDEFNSWLLGLSDIDQDIVFDLSQSLDTSMYSLEDWKQALADAKAQVEGLSDIPIDIEAETTGLEAVTSAINESASATGLAATSISELKSRYSELDGFDASTLFENTSTGVKLNTRELARLEKQYENLNKQKLSDSLQQLYRDYDDLTKQIEEYSDKSETALEDLKAQRDDVLDDIDYVKQLAAEYNGLTSAYAEWVNAQSTTQAGAWYDSAKDGLDSLKELYKSGDYGNTALQEGLEYFTNADITSIDNWQDRMQAIDAAYKQLDTTIAGTTYSINDFMAGGQDGCNNYLKAIQQLGKGWATFDAATNSWELDYNKFDLAGQLGTSVEFIEMMQDKLEQFGFQFENTQDIIPQTVDGQILQLQEAVNSLGTESVDIPVNIDTPEEQLNQVKKLIKEATSDEQLDSLYGMVDTLVAQVNQPAFMHIDTSEVEESLQEPLSLLKDYQAAVNNVEGLKIKGADASEIEAANSAVSELVVQLATLDADVLSGLGFNLDGINFDNLAAELEAQIPTLEIPVIASTASGGEQSSESLEATVNYSLGEQAPPNDMSAKVNYELGSVDKPNDVTVKVNYELGTVASPSASGGQSSASETTPSIGATYVSGTAMANGKISGAPGGRTLMGELGEELYVDPSTNRWQTVGSNGAEFVNLPRNAIVFNHRQTASLLSQGHIVGRGKAMASGNAAAMLRNIVFVNDGGSTSTSSKSADNGGKIKKTTSSGSSGSGGNSSSTDQSELKSFDWIEVLIDRVERAIDRLARIAESSYKKLTTRLDASYDQIAKVTDEISIQEQAYSRYIKEANSVGLSSNLVTLVQNGKIDINKYDDDTQDKIKQYQEYYEKALDCADAVDELHETLAELYENNFNNIQTDYENQLDMLEHVITSHENVIDSIEESGYLASTKSYAALQEATRSNVDLLNSEINALNKSFQEAMASGEIEEGSEAWYSMKLAISDVQEQIDEANLSLIEYANTMREIEWEYFDFIQERIEQLTQESDFLIDLMDSTSLFDDKGKFSETGAATVGLHGLNYNVYMAQADQYAAELLKINKELADDPSNTTLIERREELLGLQQDSILAAEGEKQAIKDLVEEGFDLELESLQELIDKYTDALDSAKDLYDYQKKIQDHTSEISSLQKQLMAYENDNSEETKATVQKLKASLQEAQDDLEETEYDQYIDDQKKLLDDLYTEYEQILNQRLDNFDAYFEEMIGSVNENASLINETLNSIASAVGYTLTDGMQNVWGNSDGSTDSVLSVYGDGFNEKLTSINKVLDQISYYVSLMIAGSDAKATSGTVAYASGGLADFTGLAQLDGTPQKPELVLNAADTQNFLELKDILREMSGKDLMVGQTYGYDTGPVSHLSGIADISSIVSAIRTPTNSDVSNSFGDIKFEISIDHVEDYNDFVNQLRSDSKFEKMIQDMTVSQLTGGSSLSKNKYRW